MGADNEIFFLFFFNNTKELILFCPPAIDLSRMLSWVVGNAVRYS